MKVVQRIALVKNFSNYEGSGQNGPYIIGTWIVKSVIDNVEFSVKCFTDIHEYFLANPTLHIDCEIETKGKPWQDKYFNELTVVSIQKPEVPADVPGMPVPSSDSMAPPAGAVIYPNANTGGVVHNTNPLQVGAGEGSDLPFN